MHRQTRAQIAQETLIIIERGSYLSPSGRTVPIRERVEASCAGTRLHSFAESADLAAAPPLPLRHETRVRVTAETTFAALQRLTRETADHVAALNFASARNPGGGFLGGAQAQEEALARSSALYPALLTQPDYYKCNRANRSALYLDLAIFAPGVCFFRDDHGALLDTPVIASVITAPAPNAGAVRQNEPDNLSRVEPVLRRRAEFVLRIAVEHRVERLVLGAWGCGVFRNDPARVADAFADLLAPGAVYAGAFREVVFAIHDSTPAQTTLGAFRQVFSTRFGSHVSHVL